MFQRNFNKRRREKPNRLRDDPVIGFRTRLSPEARGYLNRLKTQGERTEFINKAIESKIWLDTNPKGFLLNLITINFELAKYLVRKVGRTHAEGSNKKC